MTVKVAVIFTRKALRPVFDPKTNLIIDPPAAQENAQENACSLIGRPDKQSIMACSIFSAACLRWGLRTSLPARPASNSA